MQKGKNMFYFTVHMSKTLDFNGSQRPTTAHNGSHRLTSAVKENKSYSLFVLCEPL